MAFVRRIIRLWRTGLRRHVANPWAALVILIPGVWMVLLEISGCSLQNQLKQKYDQSPDLKFLLHLCLWLSILQKFWLRDSTGGGSFLTSVYCFTGCIYIFCQFQYPHLSSRCKKNAQRYIRLKMKLIFITHTSVSNTKTASCQQKHWILFG